MTKSSFQQLEALTSDTSWVFVQVRFSQNNINIFVSRFKTYVFFPTCFSFEMIGLFVCLFVLRLYGPVNPMGSCRARSVYLILCWAGLVLSVVNQYCAHSFTRNCQLPFLNQRKRMTIENISRSISTKECCRSGGGRTRNLLSTSRTRIQLSHRVRLKW